MNGDTMIERVKKTFTPPERRCETELAKIAKKLKKDTEQKKMSFFDGRNTPDEAPPTINADKKEENQED